MTTSKGSEWLLTLASASSALNARVSFRAGLLSANANACATRNSSSTLRMFNGFATGLYFMEHRPYRRAAGAKEELGSKRRKAETGSHLTLRGRRIVKSENGTVEPLRRRHIACWIWQVWKRRFGHIFENHFFVRSRKVFLQRSPSG